MSTFGCGQITRSTPPELSPQQSIADNTDGTGMRLAELRFRLVGQERSSTVLLTSL
jgi:hypothetical protein